MITDEMVERACRAFSEAWASYPDGGGKTQVTDWFDLDAQDAVDFGVLKEPKWDINSDIRSMQHEWYVAAVVKEPMHAALEAALSEPQVKVPTTAQVQAFHEAYDASLELQPRETSQAIYDGLCAALSVERESTAQNPAPQQHLKALEQQIEAAREFVKRHPALTLVDLAEFEAFLKVPAAMEAAFTTEGKDNG